MDLNIIFSKFPVVAENILQNLDLPSFWACRSISRESRGFVDYHKALWLKILIKGKDNDNKSMWKKAIQSLEIEDLIKIFSFITKVKNYDKAYEFNDPVFIAMKMGNLAIFEKVWPFKGYEILGYLPKEFEPRHTEDTWLNLVTNNADIFKYFLEFWPLRYSASLYFHYFKHGVQRHQKKICQVLSQELGGMRNRSYFIATGITQNLDFFEILHPITREKPYWLYMKQCGWLLDLHMAAKEGDLEKFQKLFTAREEFGEKRSLEELSYITPMHLAAWKGHTKICDFILQNCQYKYPIFHWYPIMYSIQHGHEDIFDLFLEKLRNKNPSDWHRKSALHYAAEFGRIKIFQKVLDLGGDVDKTDSIHNTPLHYAAKFGHTQIAILILKKSQKSMALRNIKGQNPTNVAVEFNQFEFAELLKTQQEESIDQDDKNIAENEPENSIGKHKTLIMKSETFVTKLTKHLTSLVNEFENGVVQDEEYDSEYYISPIANKEEQ